MCIPNLNIVKNVAEQPITLGLIIMKIPKNKNLFFYSFVGTPLFFNYNSSKFEGYVLDSNGARKMIFGLALNEFQMDDFIQRCYQKDLNQVKWLSKLSASMLLYLFKLG